MSSTLTGCTAPPSAADGQATQDAPHLPLEASIFPPSDQKEVVPLPSQQTLEWRVHPCHSSLMTRNQRMMQQRENELVMLPPRRWRAPKTAKTVQPAQPTAATQPTDAAQPVTEGHFGADPPT